ncbi:YTX2 protein, partial [Polyodon spathula]|nr:YTX2 protein [Polyodon spathula]
WFKISCLKMAVFYETSFITCFSVLVFLAMMERCVFISFNLNGCRQSFKRAQLVGFLEQKQAGVVFLQETHSDQENEEAWRAEWKGLCVMSHGASTSAGVAVLFKPSLGAVLLDIDEIEKGRILKVRARLGSTVYVFINIYAPNRGGERILFFKKLKQALFNINNNDVVVVGGDFNCTVNFNIDRNNDEPHPQSSRELAALLESSDLVDIWRCLHPSSRQYTWSQYHTDCVYRARLDRFYTSKNDLNKFIKARIIPSSLSDHHCLLITVLIQSEPHRASYWHFNVKLLQDVKFKQQFKLFWIIWKKEKAQYKDLRQWWDIGKIQIKCFCQQYTINATRSLNTAVRELESKILLLEERLNSEFKEQTLENLKEQKIALGSLLKERVKGAIVRSRFMELRDMDAPTSFFFNLERKRADSRQLCCIRTPGGKELHTREEISREAVRFYKELYNKELCNIEDTERLLQGLPSLSEKEQIQLDAPLTHQEMTAAVKQLSSGKVPGIDGLPAEFYNNFWDIMGEDLLQVLRESLSHRELPLSCRRAVVTLLPKKGDLCQLKNWRPVSILCSDLKILSKTIANRLKSVIGTVIHMDQTYCIPGRSIFDNLFFIRDFLTVSDICDFNVGMVSLDQEKAFDRVDHTYLFHTLEAFGFGPGFISYIRLLYSNIFSILKINNGLSQPFPVCRGIRQGCALSGMLYSLVIEPLLHLLRVRLAGWTVPSSPSTPSSATVKVSAYADDVTVFVRGDADVQALQQTLNEFQRASSARVNWAKCDTFLSGGWDEGTPPFLPEGLKWNRTGIKVLGVYLGTENYMKKNWEGLLDRVRGRLQRWKGLLAQLSFKGRVLVINNLVASSLWHKLVCLDPPQGLVKEIQSVLLEFFWSGRHSLRPAVLYLPSDEGGQGLVSIASRVAAFRLQAVQRLLYTEEEAHWKRLACFLLNRFGGLGLGKHLFLIENTSFSKAGLPPFYQSILKAWQLVRVERDVESLTGQDLFEEPLFFNPLFPVKFLQSMTLCASFLKAGVTRMVHLLNLELSCWLTASQLTAQLGWHSERLAERLMGELRGCLSPRLKAVLREELSRGTEQRQLSLFPGMIVSPAVGEEGEGGGENGGTLLKLQNVEEIIFHTMNGKQIYKLCVKATEYSRLRGLVDSKWRAYLAVEEGHRPVWRVLYKPPLAKRVGDLQWKILHCIVSTGRFLHRVDPSISEQCAFCSAEETLFHAYSECERLRPLFNLLQGILNNLGVVFSKELFIFGVLYSFKMKNRCVLINFLFGQAKLAILKTRKNQLSGSGLTSLVVQFRVLVVSQIRVEFEYFKLVSNLEDFQERWCVGDALCAVSEEGELQFLF